MGRSKKRNANYNKVLEQLVIEGVAAEGKSITRHNDLVIFVPFGAPGDVVDVRITKTRRRHLEGEIIHFHQKSPCRTTPFCEHFGICGGCKWQHLSYAEQLKFKQQQVTDQLRRIAKIDYEWQLLPTAASLQTEHYRNKLEYTFADRRWFSREEISSGEQITNTEALGFHVPGVFDKVINIEKCWLQPEPSNAIRLEVKRFALEQQMSFYNFKENKGLLRNIIIRNNQKDAFMVILITTSESPQMRNMMLDHIKSRFPQVVSLFYMINDKKNSSINDLEAVHYHGEPFIWEEMEGLKFKVGPKTFYQTNSLQAYELYKTTREFAALTGQEVVYDLYTGTGTIAHFVASQAQKVVGIEYVEEAVVHARENAALNQLQNLSFTFGDMAKVLNEDFIANAGKPDVIITDPPRAGMHPDVVRQIARSGAQRVVYVSCNPATQARDIELLSDVYKIAKARAVDMFPHTQHVESVVLLEKK